MHLSSLLLGAIAATAVTAHPGHDIRAEHAERQAILDLVGRSDYGRCADKLKARGVEARAIARREELAKKMMKKRNLEGKSCHINASRLDEPSRNRLTPLPSARSIYARGTHQSNATYTLQTPASEIFASTDFCFLSPEVTEGPYYVAGEYIREDITEDQAGVDLALDLQVYDVETCEPVPNVYLEIWRTFSFSPPPPHHSPVFVSNFGRPIKLTLHVPDCNSTGVYSGVSANGNGNGDAANLNATFLRGLQQTDADGIAQFETLFPGHYTGRATHIHVMVHVDPTVFPNNTIRSTTASHVGQIYFDQDLITEVEAEPVYNTNTQQLTLNSDDMLLQQGSQVGDPIVNYVYLGSTVSEGLLGWIGFGINTTLSKDVSAAATFYESGGVANSNGGFPGGGAGGPPSGFPSGGFPTGVRPTGASSSAAATAAPACNAKKN